MFTNRPALRQETKLEVQERKTKKTEVKEEFKTIRDAVQEDLLTNSKSEASKDQEQIRAMIEESFNEVLEEEKILYNYSTRIFNSLQSIIYPVRLVQRITSSGKLAAIYIVLGKSSFYFLYYPFPPDFIDTEVKQCGTKNNNHN